MLCILLQTSLLNENNKEPIMFNNQKVKQSNQTLSSFK